ncbi:hypothetical protein [Vannielia litorea]|uniref:Capsule polysaccharide biosynthesis protein n=1 Tax=Vannielia litorea TaxID=1217970 RepID=A0A1N6HKC6_9RHOB|nr:hypothetical protein [Vannielia litorea]SIO20186.1 hypothetical protein SAMN05444002_3454 [Vannielia litorea]
MGRETLRILLDDPSLQRVRAGSFNFFNRLIGIVEKRGWAVEVMGNSLADRDAAVRQGGPTLVHMDAPPHDGALCCRRAYLGAFWRIERSHERWAWPVAKAEFDPMAVDGEAAERFFGNWRNWNFDRGRDVGDDGFVLVPLQGRLQEHRSFQAMSPLEMLDCLLERTDRPVVATLHPRESYSEAELAALAALAERHARLEVAQGVSDMLLRRCSYVATQNSSLAFQGYFLEKAAILFGEIDFHHIAGSLPRDGVEAAFARLEQRPEFARYLHWFLTGDTVNAGQDEFDEQLPARLRTFGWNL